MENHGQFPIVWQVKMPAKQTAPVAEYTLTSAEDVPPRHRKLAFPRFAGRKQWTLLNERRDAGVACPKHAKNLQVHNKTVYAQYRFEFLEVHGVPHFQIAEIAVDGKIPDNAVRNYRRELDLSRAVHTVSYGQTASAISARRSQASRAR